MALSPEFIEDHIATWQRQLSSPFYPHRKHWPARLFHHAPLENALGILREGVILSRNASEMRRGRDVAAQGVIDARQHAHDRVRLYFRPKTPTQFHIEGIRRQEDCKYPGAHAPLLIMFVLDARTVLCLPDTQFSDRNMQLYDTIPGDTEQYFREIPFAKVFSEGGTGGDRTITDARCAEILPASPLQLKACLREIYFRSEPERDTVLHLLGDQAAEWTPYCHVSDALKVFEKLYAFVREIGLTPEGVTFKLNPRCDRKNISLRIRVWARDGRQVIDFWNDDFPPLPNNPQGAWIFRSPLAEGIYRVEVEIDGCRAYCGEIPLESVLF